MKLVDYFDVALSALLLVYMYKVMRVSSEMNTSSFHSFSSYSTPQDSKKQT